MTSAISIIPTSNHIFSFFSRKTYHFLRKLKGGSKKSNANKTKGTAGLKSFNSTYIDLILSSEQFRNDATEFMEEFFVQDYIKTRYQKIDKLLKQTRKLLEAAWEDYQYSLSNRVKSDKGSLKDFLIMRIKENTKNNSKSKLPWTNAELEEAKVFAKQRIMKAKNILEMTIEQEF